MAKAGRRVTPDFIRGEPVRRHGIYSRDGIATVMPLGAEGA